MWHKKRGSVMCKEKKTLIVTNKEDITADYVVLELQERSTAYFRFNTEDFPEKIIATVCLDGKKTVVSFKGVKGTSDLDEVYSIWYRRPGVPSVAEEIEDPGVKEFCKRESEEFLEGVYSLFKGLWVSYPPYIFQAQNKLYQLDLARNFGFDVPYTIISNDAERIRKFIKNSSYKVIAKAVRQGILEIDRREHVIFTNPVGEKHLEALSDVKFSPCIFQEYIQKKFDVRVTVIGDKVFPVEIHTSPNIPSCP